MNGNNTKKIYLYTLFERFWHWAQAGLVIVLAVTGYEIHGVYELFGFNLAHDIHVYSGWSLVILYVFIVFWLLTTGEWKHYAPTTKKVLCVAKYYGCDIFRGMPHPVPKSERVKHNPLQRLTYLGVAAVIMPFQIVTGFLYLQYNNWEAWGLDFLSLGVVAFLHMAGAFALLTFLVVHVYMTTTGHSVFGHLKAMFTGWEEVEESKS